MHPHKGHTARGHPHGLKPLGDARRLSLISGGMQAEAALALEFERVYLRLSSAFVSQAAMCSGGKACGVTQAAAGDRILTFNDVLAIARGAGLLKVQSLRAGFGRGGMVQPGSDAF